MSGAACTVIVLMVQANGEGNIDVRPAFLLNFVGYPTLLWQK